MIERIEVIHKGKRYTVVRDALGILRIEYINAVMGRTNLFLDAPLAKAILKSLEVTE